MIKKMMALILFVAVWGLQSLTAVSQDNDTYISEEIQGYCVEIGERYGVCPELLMAMIETESSGNPKAENGGCYGLMQVSTKYHSDRMERLGVTDIYDSYGNILVGTDYLMELAEEYGDIGVVLMKYNGFSKAEEYAEQGKLSKYAEKILERSADLEIIHGK